jgi:cyanophycinase-like exopeptidase
MQCSLMFFIGNNSQYLIRVLQDTRYRDIGTPRGFGVDEDTALVVTDLYTRPIGKVLKINSIFQQKLKIL